MLLDAPSLPVFLLIPLVCGIVVGLVRERFEGLLVPSVLAACAATVICVAVGIWQAGYSATGTTIGAVIALTCYLPICAAVIAITSRLRARVGRRG